MVCRSALCRQPLGAEILVPILDGQTKLRIPEGTQTGTSSACGLGGLFGNRFGLGDQHESQGGHPPLGLLLAKAAPEEFAQVDANADPRRGEKERAFLRKVRDLLPRTQRPVGSGSAEWLARWK